MLQHISTQRNSSKHACNVSCRSTSLQLACLNCLPHKTPVALPLSLPYHAVRRDLVLAAIDPNFYQQFLNASVTVAVRASRANYGLDVSDAAAAAAAADLGSSMPTDSGYLCSLGQPRRQLAAIQVLSKACYVKVVSAPGDGYEVHLRTHKE